MFQTVYLVLRLQKARFNFLRLFVVFFARFPSTIIQLRTSIECQLQKVMLSFAFSFAV